MLLSKTRNVLLLCGSVRPTKGTHMHNSTSACPTSAVLASFRKDKQRAAALYEQAANQGLENAQYNLALCYGFGLGVAKDERRAFTLLQAAANQGHASAQSCLADRYLNGTGVTQDHEQAARYWQLAADQGHAEGQNNLACLYARGLGVQQDQRRAVQLWQLSADQGHAPAQFSLSVGLFYGCDGVPQNIELAYKLCKLAASQGQENAIGLLPAMKSALEPRACASCAVVESAARTYPKCAGCNVVRYCGAECQRAHWKAHKGECKELLAKAETEMRGVFASMSKPQGRR
jgi:hypothetical protein